MKPSILLDPATWDLTLDNKGHIALGTTPYSQAQSVACALRLFKGELWYNVSRGMPYFQNILGKFPPPNFLRLKMESLAYTIDGILTARCVLVNNNRKVGGQIQLKFRDGSKASLSL